MLDNHTFTVMLDIKHKDPKTLETEAIYFFLGTRWLITIHSEIVHLKEVVERLFKIKNKKIKEAPIDALYYNILADLVTKYEQLLTGVELSVNKYQKRSFVRPSPEIFGSIENLSRQTILLRRHFWRARAVINFLVHNEHDEVKYIDMVYDRNFSTNRFCGVVRRQQLIRYENFTWLKSHFKLMTRCESLLSLL